MQQIRGTSKVHPFQIVNPTTGVIGTTLTSPHYYYKINGEVTEHVFTPVIVTYNTNMKTFGITIASTLAVNVGDEIELTISATEGEQHLIITVTDKAFIDYTLTEMKTSVNATMGNVFWLLFKHR